jgi:hypothetical protein
MIDKDDDAWTDEVDEEYWTVLRETALMFGMSEADVDARIAELKPEYEHDMLFYHHEPINHAAAWADISNYDDYITKYLTIRDRHYE